MKRRDNLRLLAALSFAPLAARAQTGRKVGYVLLGPRSDTALRLDTLRAGLKLANPAFAQAEIVAETTEATRAGSPRWSPR